MAIKAIATEDKSALVVKAKIETWSLRLVRERPATYVKRAIHGPECAADILAFMRELTEEHCYAVALNAKNEPIGLYLISKGSLSTSIMHPREVFKAAVLANAHALILAHNHPTGNTTPSCEDKHVTREMVKAGKILGIPVMDHVILGDDCHSLRESHPDLWS